MIAIRLRWLRIHFWSRLDRILGERRWIREVKNFSEDYEFIPSGEWVDWRPRSEDDRRIYVRMRFRKWYARHPVQRADVVVTAEFLRTVKKLGVRKGP